MISIERIIELRKAHQGDGITPWSQTIDFAQALIAEVNKGDCLNAKGAPDKTMISTDKEKLEQLVKWHRETWIARTRAVEAGEPGSLFWVPPEARIMMCEVQAKAEELGVEDFESIEFRMWAYLTFDCKKFRNVR